MRWLLPLITALFSFNASAGDIEIHQPHFYEILRENSALECRYVSDESFGFLLERGNGDAIHVTLITAGKNEGEASGFFVGVKAKAAIGLHLYLYERSGNYGRYVEFELRNQVDALLGYRFPGTYMQVSALYTKGEQGTEQENLYPDVMKRMACRIL